MIGNLARRDWKGAQSDTGQLQADQVADAFGRADLDLRGESHAQGFAGHLCTHRQYEYRCAQQFDVANDGHADAVFALLQIDRHGCLFEHHGQRLAQVSHQGAKAAGQVVVAVLGVARRAALFTKSAQLAGQPQAQVVQAFGVQHGQALQVGKQGLEAVDDLQQQKVDDLAGASAAGLRQP